VLQAYPLTPNLSAKVFIKFAFQSIISAVPAIREISIWVVEASLVKAQSVGYMRKVNSKLSDIISEESSVRGGTSRQASLRGGGGGLALKRMNSNRSINSNNDESVPKSPVSSRRKKLPGVLRSPSSSKRKQSNPSPSVVVGSESDEDHSIRNRTRNEDVQDKSSERSIRAGFFAAVVDDQIGGGSGDVEMDSDIWCTDTAKAFYKMAPLSSPDEVDLKKLEMKNATTLFGRKAGKIPPLKGLESPPTDATDEKNALKGQLDQRLLTLVCNEIRHCTSTSMSLKHFTVSTGHCLIPVGSGGDQGKGKQQKTPSRKVYEKLFKEANYDGEEEEEYGYEGDEEIVLESTPATPAPDTGLEGSDMPRKKSILSTRRISTSRRVPSLLAGLYNANKAPVQFLSDPAELDVQQGAASLNPSSKTPMSSQRIIIGDPKKGQDKATAPLPPGPRPLLKSLRSASTRSMENSFKGFRKTSIRLKRLNSKLNLRASITSSRNSINSIDPTLLEPYNVNPLQSFYLTAATHGTILL
jgi:hypothetical protein